MIKPHWPLCIWEYMGIYGNIWEYMGVYGSESKKELAKKGAEVERVVAATYFSLCVPYCLL